MAVVDQNLLNMLFGPTPAPVPTQQTRPPIDLMELINRATAPEPVVAPAGPEPISGKDRFFLTIGDALQRMAAFQARRRVPEYGDLDRVRALREMRARRATETAQAQATAKHKSETARASVGLQMAKGQLEAEQEMPGRRAILDELKSRGIFIGRNPTSLDSSDEDIYRLFLSDDVSKRHVLK